MYMFWPVFTYVCCMLYLCELVCPIFVWLVKSMSCMSCLSGLGVIHVCLVCLGCLSFLLPTSFIASVLCTCISM